MRIAFYVSDHGYGHATRTVRFAQKFLLLYKNIQFVIISGQPQVDVMRGMLPENNQISYRIMDKLDVGILIDSHGLYDRKKTKTEVQKWIDSWDKIVISEAERLSQDNISMIFTDISPIGALTGAKLGIKTIGVSNFTWVEQFEGILDAEYLKKLKNAYSTISLLLRYRLSMPMEWLTTLSMELSDFWVIPESNEQNIKKIKEKYGDKKIIFIGFGGMYENQMPIDVSDIDANFILGAKANVIAKNPVRLNAIDDYYDYMSASDLIISKAGWGIINEAISAQVPVFLIKRDVPEDIWNTDEVEKLGYGKAVEFDNIAEEIKQFLS